MTIKQRPRLAPEFIHPEAYRITERLQREGFETYLVGGCVRDLLSGIQPKDYDIATYASPKQVKKFISDAYIIGKRFRLVLVKRGSDLFEVATFRRDATDEEMSQIDEDDKTSGDNVFGTPQEDALRRDFTLNGLFYDPVKDELKDYCHGLKDIKSHTLRMIGDPVTRLQEDPIRILRALRLSHRLDFKIESSLRESMKTYAHTLKKSVLPRRREEILKIMRLQDPSNTLMEAHDLHILEHVFPSLDKIYLNPEQLNEFNMYIKKISTFVIDIDNPAEVFAYLMLAYYRSTVDPDPFKKVFASDILKHEDLKQIMTMELGMYNVEQSLFAKALEFQHRLKKLDQDSHQNEAIPLAIMMAKADHVLSSEKMHEWERVLEKIVPKAHAPYRKKRRTRRPRNFQNKR
ncbi:MAG: poly(A) polymerase [Bdellovibrionota bacterium]